MGKGGEKGKGEGKGSKGKGHPSCSSLISVVCFQNKHVYTSATCVAIFISHPSCPTFSLIGFNYVSISILQQISLQAPPHTIRG